MVKEFCIRLVILLAVVIASGCSSLSGEEVVSGEYHAQKLDLEQVSQVEKVGDRLAVLGKERIYYNGSYFRPDYKPVHIYQSDRMILKITKGTKGGGHLYALWTPEGIETRFFERDIEEVATPEDAICFLLDSELMLDNNSERGAVYCGGSMIEENASDIAELNRKLAVLKGNTVVFDNQSYSSNYTITSIFEKDGSLGYLVEVEGKGNLLVFNGSRRSEMPDEENQSIVGLYPGRDVLAFKIAESFKDSLYREKLIVGDFESDYYRSIGEFVTAGGQVAFIWANETGTYLHFDTKDYNPQDLSIKNDIAAFGDKVAYLASPQGRSSIRIFAGEKEVGEFKEVRGGLYELGENGIGFVAKKEGAWYLIKEPNGKG